MFVLDASVALAGIFEDEPTPAAYMMLPQLVGEPAAAPAIWPLEVANVLRMAERRGRQDPAKTSAYLRELEAQPILVEMQSADTSALLDIARAHDLTVYDACYLELALRLARPLATLDRLLAAAARAEGVPVVS